MRPFILRALLLSVGTILGSLAVAGIASASGPLMPIVVTWPTSGPVHVGEALTIEANCPVLTTTPNGAPVFDSITVLRLGAKVLWRQPSHIKPSTQQCFPTGDGGCAWPNTGVCAGSYINQTPAVFEINMPSGAETGKIMALDSFGSVIAEGKVTVFGSHPQPTVTTVPTGTHTKTPPKTPPKTAPKTPPTSPGKPAKPTTPHVTSPAHLPWWRAIWDRVVGWF